MQNEFVAIQPLSIGKSSLIHMPHPAEENGPFDIGVIDREIVNLDREEGLFRVWRFLLHMFMGNHPAGLIFLCGNAEHGPDYFAERLGRNGGVDVYEIFNFFPDLKPANLPAWTSRDPDLLKSEKYPPYLANAVKRHIKHGINGIKPGKYANLEQIYSSVQDDMGQRLFFFPLRVDAAVGPKFMRSHPPRKIVEEFDAFAKVLKDRGDGPKPIFLFCVFVNGAECGTFNADFVEDDLEQQHIAVASAPLVSVLKRKYEACFPISGKPHYWGISSWEMIKFSQVEEFLSGLASSTDDAAKIRVRTLIRDLEEEFEEGQRLPMKEIRSRIDLALSRRR